MAKRFFTPIDLTGTINENNAAPERSMKWSDGEGTIEVGLKGGNVKLAVGQEELSLCYNGTGSSLSKGQVVYISGAQGQRPSISLSSASSESTSSKTLGVVAETISNNSEGFVCTFGVVRDINTSLFSEGSALWLSTTSGAITSTMPDSPNHGVFIGYCLKSHASAGQIFVKIQNGYELEELHNVLITSPSTGQVLEYDSATGLWKNSNPAEGAVFEVFYQNDAPVSPQLGDIWVDANEDLPNYDNISIDGLVPNQSGNSGKYLTTNGSAVSWASVDLSSYAPLSSPSLTGIPTAPTAIAGTNTTQIATTEFVQGAATAAAAALIDSAPETLDTLNELAAALGDDPNYATTISTALGNKQPLDADLTAIAALTGSVGFLKKTAEDTWTIDTNTYLTGNQTITLSGDVSGSGTTSIEVTIADDSHNHIIGNVDGLQTALDGKASTSHAASHGNAGSDAITIAQSQVTNLTTDLADKAPLSSPSFTGTVTIDGISVQDTSTTIISSNTSTSISSIPASTYRSAEYLVQVVQGEKQTISKLIMIHDGTTANITEYALIELGVSRIPLTLSCDISSGNVVLSATITDASSTNATVRVVKTAIVL